MSITFTIKNPHMVRYHGREIPSGSKFTCPTCHGDGGFDCANLECYVGMIRPSEGLNLANANGADLLRFLGIPSAPGGEIDSLDLRERIEAASAKQDFGRFGQAYTTPNGVRVFEGTRPASRMSDYLDALLELCDRSDELGTPGVIVWG